MGLGCLIKVSTQSSGTGQVTTAYLVSEQDADRAINIIKSKINPRADEVVFVSRISEELLKALGVEPGDFRRADGYPS
jgi:hypothetical protein